MHRCSKSKCVLLGALATVFLLSVVRGEANIVNQTPLEKATTASMEGQKNSILVPIAATTEQPLPVKPNAPDCFMHFPGTPGWNACFQKFNENMLTFQTKIQEYVKSHEKDGSSNGGTTFTRFSPDYYSGPVYINSNSFSTSNSYTGGYSIHATNMGLSTSIINNVVKVVLRTGPIDKFETKTNGNEITIDVISKGQQKFAKVKVPTGVNVADVKVERSSDSVFLTGPTTMNDGGSFQISQSDSTGSSSSFGSTNINQFGQMQAGSIPQIQTHPFEMPIFNNMFQNILGNLFGFQKSFDSEQMHTNSNNRDSNRFFPQKMYF